MTVETIDTDYLIIGSGAMGMAFADVLLKESDATMVIVDRHHQPGGHWNDAYPFVRLHQSSSRYGVNSQQLGSGAVDRIGLNRGLDELASSAEILSYFDNLMRHELLPSGRVRYLPMSQVDDNDTVTSLLHGGKTRINVRKKVIDSAIVDIAVPSTHPPQYAVAPGVRCIPLNELTKIKEPPSGYVVVGSGKTGIDACLWLLENGVNPDDIRWVMPRDAWMMNRETFQTHAAALGSMLTSIGNQMDAVASAASMNDLLLRLESYGNLMRFDKSIMPTMYRCATVTPAELHELQRIKNVIRMGHVQSIEPDKIVLTKGTLAAKPDWLYVNCSARAFKQEDQGPIFNGRKIKLQCVRTCQPVFSSAFIAHIELTQPTDADKNELCKPVPLPALPPDWLKMLAVTMRNQNAWSKHEDLRHWLFASRLDGQSAMLAGVKESDAANFALLQRFRSLVPAAVAKLPALLATV